MAFADSGAAKAAHANEKYAGCAPHFFAIGLVRAEQAGEAHSQARKKTEIALACARQIFSRTHTVSDRQSFAVGKWCDWAIWLKTCGAAEKRRELAKLYMGDRCDIDRLRKGMRIDPRNLRDFIVRTERFIALTLDVPAKLLIHC